MDIIQAIDNPKLFKKWFKNREDWKAWRSFLKALFAIQMSPSERAIFEHCTERKFHPKQVAEEAWLVVGRRGGKSFILALIAVFLACFKEWGSYLVPGEIPCIKIVAADRKQARVILKYILALLRETPALQGLVETELRESVELTNGVLIEVGTASYRTIRSYTIVAALLDEVAFWDMEGSANPDQEVLNAIRPSTATIPEAMILAASSPYSRKGVLWQNYRSYYSKDDKEILVWNADTRTMNPTVTEAFVEKQYKRDPASASAEYGAEFRTDVEAFISEEVVEGCTDSGVFELPRVPGTYYKAFCDPSGGSGDSFALAIAHAEEDGTAVLDLLDERKPPFSPERVAEDFSTTLKRYGISEVTGDRYGGEWPREQFRKHGITYEVAEHTKSQLYREVLPMLNSGTARLLDNKILFAQLVNLERRVARGGRDNIDHPLNGHDDVANAAAGALVLVGDHGPIDMWEAGDTPPDPKHEEQAALNAGWHQA